MYLLMFNLNKTSISGPGSLSHHSFPISSLSTYLEMIKQAVFGGEGRSFFTCFQCKQWLIYVSKATLTISCNVEAEIRKPWPLLLMCKLLLPFCHNFITIVEFHPIKLVIVTSLWCWLIWWLYWPIDSNLKKHVYWLWTEFKHIDCYDCMRTNRVQPCNSLTLDLNRWVEWKTVCSWERWVGKNW